MTRIDSRRNRVAVLFGITLLLTGLAFAEDEDLVLKLRQHVGTLASDELEGRLTGTPGAAAAADYIIGQLEAIGAVPLEGREFRIPFEFTAGVNDGGSSIALPAGQRWSDAADVLALSFSDDGMISAPAVFAGYGLVIPESQGYPYDSYATLDVEDKIVVVLRYFPEDVDQDARAILSRYSGLRYKAMQAREKGAAGMIVVTGPRSANAGKPVPLTFDTAVAGSGIVAGSVSAAVADALLAATGRDLETVQAELDTGNPHVTGFDLGTEVDLEIAIERETKTGYNVVAMLPPTSEQGLSPDKPWLMIGAHYDHLGRGVGGNSLARDEEAGDVHNGADDNASGVAANLAAAAQLAGMERDRAVLVAFWSGEEMGLLGANAFVRSEIVPMESLAAYINFDMVGRSRDNKVAIQAVGSSSVWPGLIERSNIPVGFDLELQEDPFVPTDSAAFNTAGVPTLTFFTGSHEDYHRPTDDADRINYEDLGRISRLGALVAHKVANLDASPDFVVVQQTAPAGDRDSVRAFTGTIPDYASGVEGLLLGGVIEGGPAEEAGLRGGDVIVEFAGQTITNIYDYTYALDSVKVDVPIRVVYLRDGERFETTLTPRARE